MNNRCNWAFLTYLSFSFLYGPIFLHAQSTPPVDHGNIRDIRQKRVFWWSSSAPLQTYLNEYPEFISSSANLSHHFARIESGILAQLQNSARRNGSMHPCNRLDRKAEGMRQNIVNNFFHRGYPTPDVSCFTEHCGVDVTPFGPSEYSEKDVYNALFERGETIRKHVRQVANVAIGNFSQPDVVHNFHYSTATTACSLQLVSGTRVGKWWYTLIQITNVPIFHHTRDYGRQYLEEYVRMHNETRKLAWPLIMKLREVGTNGTLGKWHNDTTTSINNRRWTANAGFLRRTSIRANPAVRKALEKTDEYVRRATDAKTVSNTAILLLPLGLNLVPVSIFAHVTTAEMLMYVILSDVITVLPLFIKGVDLLRISRQKHYAVVTRISSGVRGVSPSAAGEIFAAACGVVGNVRVMGNAFVGIAVGFMVGGVALEIAGRVYCERKCWRKKMVEITAFEKCVGAGVLATEYELVVTRKVEK